VEVTKSPKAVITIYGGAGTISRSKNRQRTGGSRIKLIGVAF
jgi:hypothetical protein